ncbi:hypothetical protein BKA70DRAFT_1331948 [Coprinopsis sp. MPI-PUGE-AT-0042]|nr:hypothetical protein BKA70DRAFT_1331948 [Coprinopsis sp. MPI-PUGE-AT-0042]
MSAALLGFWTHSFRSYNDALLDSTSAKGAIADDIASLMMFLGFSVLQFQLCRRIMQSRYCQKEGKCKERAPSSRFAQVSAVLFLLYLVAGILFTTVFVMKMSRAPLPSKIERIVSSEAPPGMCTFQRTRSEWHWVEGQYVGGYQRKETSEWRCFTAALVELTPIFILETVGGSLLQVLILVADALLLYRCYAVFLDKPVVYRVGGFVFLTSFVLSVVYIAYCISEGYSSRNPEPKSLPAGFNLHQAAAIYISCSTAVNLFVTIAISSRIISAKRRLDVALQDVSASQESMGAHKTAVIILVEAALPASLVGIVLAVITVPLGNREISIKNAVSPRAIRVLWVSLLAIAPQIIAIRVAEGRSWSETQSEVVSRSIAFGEGQKQRQSGTMISQDPEEARLITPIVDTK